MTLITLLKNIWMALNTFKEILKEDWILKEFEFKIYLFYFKNKILKGNLNKIKILI